MLEIIFGHHILNIYLRHLFTNVCILRCISFATSQVSHPYRSTDFTQALNILILVSFRIDLDSHTLLSLENDPLAFCILALTSLFVPLFLATMLHLICVLDPSLKYRSVSSPRYQHCRVGIEIST